MTAASWPATRLSEEEGHELLGGLVNTSSSSSSSSTTPSSSSARSKLQSRRVLCCLGTVSLAAVAGATLLVFGRLEHHHDPLQLEPVATAAMTQESPDEIYEFFDDSTPIEGSEHWATCWHWDIRQCPKPKQNYCCCNPGFIFVRKMSSPMLRAVAAFEGSKAKSLGGKSLEGMVGAFQGVATQQLEGECMKPKTFPSSIAKEVED
mmetsp:Transcript_86022/g.179886  ORF Transcript_86022/g.179886 Transcript_86022/m.179886 type:complete len:206 (-) Transcript_86022:589-1206(-)|eukprot:CAMPEP_0206439354 /NCGR_PEP_ID=MMETSP0324_2-20121206/12159_1 /ASSEMBLY_ACC=CAM_ASM_000836 /TAXON_ID=2866 /ORGANISM="Crypthecodinium cohnii, Strain Seligo" /LENGTH=205 /DNA_ID=CAMNT_0053906955 /DNA_START=309 /DNA_END=926 /DNA_ORIENTATION=+